MIYAGILNFSSLSVTPKSLTKAVESFTKNTSSIIRKDDLILCYGKLSSTQDMDNVWENDSSILIGRVFEKDNSCSLKEETFRNFSHLKKENILNKVWGKYLYFNIHEENSQFDIVIDPTGQLPFFYHILPNGNILFSSDIEIIFKVLSQKLDYNWEYLYSYLIYGNSSSIETPFKNIFELPPACSLKITKNERKTSPFWNPLNSSKKIETPKKDAVSVLQSTLKPLIEPYQTVCVSLSGGLDSSSLVYCLKDIVKKDQTLKALNYFHSEIKSSNELVHARKVCEETDIELMEIDASECLPFDPSKENNILKPNKPFPGLVSLRWQEIISKYIPVNNPSIFLSGHGSDHIFMRPPSKSSLSDYILEKGFKDVKEPLKDITTFYRDTLFSIFRENAMKLGSYFLSLRLDKRNPKNILDKHPDWVKKELLQKTSPEFVHPIYETLSKKVLPGKYDQIDAFYEGLASIHMEMDPIIPTYYPFLYEPVVEFALSFPTYELFDKGYDRYPLRKSVSDSFKTETVWRRDKSQTTGIFQLGVKKNMDYILELCLEGHFVKQGLIDRASLYKTITRIGNGDIKFFWSFIHLASIELFLKYWEEKAL